MRKELEVVGGVKSLVHCRCQMLYSMHSHPAAATIYTSIPPACRCVCSISTAPFVVVIYHFSVFVIPLFLHFLTSMASDSGGTEVCWVVGEDGGGRPLGGRGVCVWGWGGHWVCQVRQNKGQEAGRKEDGTLHVKCYCLCDGTAGAPNCCRNWQETQVTHKPVNFSFRTQN